MTKASELRELTDETLVDLDGPELELTVADDEEVEPVGAADDGDAAELED